MVSSVKQLIAEFTTQITTHKLQLDIQRSCTFAGMILLGFSAIVTALITYFGNQDSDLRDLLLLCLIIVFRSILLAMVIRFLDSLASPVVGFVLLMALMILTTWNETYDVTRTTLPVLREFPSVSSSKAPIFDIVALASLIIAIVPSTIRVSRLKAVYRSFVVLWHNVRRNPTRITVLVGCVAWPGMSYSIMIHAFEIFFVNPNYDFIDFVEYVYEINYLLGAHVHYLQGIVIYLIFSIVSSITSSRLQRNLGLLSFCFGVIITYAISFRWPFEVLPGLASPDYGPLLWSAPALVLLLASAIARMFSTSQHSVPLHAPPAVDPSIEQ